MNTVPMRKLEVVALKRDTDAVLEELALSGAFEFEEAGAPREDGAPRESGEGEKKDGSADEASPFESSALVEALAYLGIEDTRSSPVRLPDTDALRRAISVIDAVRDLKERETKAREGVTGTEDLERELVAFRSLGVKPSELETLTYLAMRVGNLAPEAIEGLRAQLGDRAIIVPLGEPGRIAAVSSRKGRFALDSELAKAGFVALSPPVFEGDDLESALKELEKRLETDRALLAATEEEKSALSAAMAATLPGLIAGFRARELVERMKRTLGSTDQTYRLCGWTPADRLSRLVERLRTVTDGRIAVDSYRPEEIDDVRSGKEKVPVLVRHGWFVSGFKGLVFSYGTPLYGTIDPTPFVAVFFVILFSIMFGDVGQGFVILAAGILLPRLGAKAGKLARYAPALVACGAGSMVMGFLDGSVFANERLLVGFTRALTGAITGRSVDRLIVIMPEGGVGRLFAFFGFTLAVGVGINVIGIAINVYNSLKTGKTARALFSKTGLAGFLFLGGSIGTGITVLVGATPSIWNALSIGIPLLVILLSDPLGRILERKRPVFHEGIANFAITALVELIESVSYWFSNTMSFLRVGAFALSHAVLSFIIFTGGSMLREAAPGGFVGEFVVYVIGNIVIIGLEGLIVTIQVIRLQYYEFFSKFFTESGEEFAPFGFDTRRSGK